MKSNTLHSKPKRQGFLLSYFFFFSFPNQTALILPAIIMHRICRSYDSSRNTCDLSQKSSFMAKRHSDQLESLLTMELWTFGLKLKVKSENLFFLAVAQSLETFARAAGKVFVVSKGTDRGIEVALRAIQPFCVDRALRDAVSALSKAQPQSVGGASVGGSGVGDSGVGGDEEDDSSYEEEVAIVKTKLDSLQALINALAQSKSKDSTALIHTQLEAQVKELVESLPDEEAPLATAAPPIVAPAQPPPPTAKSWDVELQELAAATARLFTVRIIEEVMVHFGLDGTSAEAARLSAVNAACRLRDAGADGVDRPRDGAEGEMAPPRFSRRRFGSESEDGP